MKDTKIQWHPGFVAAMNMDTSRTESANSLSTFPDNLLKWHPGFVAAMNLEFAEDRAGVIFEKEYNLNTKPYG